MSVTAAFTFDSEMHYRAARAVTRHTRARFVTPGILVTGIAFVLWNARSMWGRADPLTMALSLVPYVLLVGLWVSLVPWTQRRQARSLAARDASSRGLQERTIDGQGFHSRGNGVALDVPWHVLTRAVETEELFLLFYNRQCAYYLPKVVLDARQVDDARALIREHLGERARLFAA